MKIVILNYAYHITGGPERYLFNIKAMLEAKGHVVIPYSVQSPKNVESPYEAEFLPQVGNGEFNYQNFGKSGIGDKIKRVTRLVYSVEAKKHFKKFLQKYKPDLVYVLYYQNKISCSVINAAKELNIPVVQRISDFSLICPNASFYDYKSGNICEKCLHGSVCHAIKQKCVHGSAALSGLKSLAIKVQNLCKIKEKIDAFVFPSSYTMSKFIAAGYDENKLYHIPTPFNKGLLNDIPVSYGDFALYVGRLDSTKGLETLVRAFLENKKPLKIIGDSKNGYKEYLEKIVEGKEHNIEFLGWLEFNDIQKYLSTCLFTLIPSEWYDNLPNTLLESYALQKCVVATDLGSLAENVQDKKTGLLFKYRDISDLAEKANKLFDDVELAKQLGENAYSRIDEVYSANVHYDKLMRVFEEVVK